MNVVTMQGYFDKGLFYQDGRKVTLPEGKMVIVNILDVSPPAYEVENPHAWLDEFLQLVEATLHEQLRLEDFPRMDLGRDIVS